jgi:drug/metabolite transporter (DMT)-like permease
LGLAGIAIVFWPEIAAFTLSSTGSLGLVLALTGTASASLGMLTSGRAQAAGLPVIQANAYGMGYGTLFLTGFCLARGAPFDFDPSFPYVVSLVFLAVFATVIGFWSYLTLLGRIGADRAAYVSVLFPIVALALSTAFEGYHWTVAAAGGIALTVVGNVLILSRGRKDPEPAATIKPAD